VTNFSTETNSITVSFFARARDLVGSERINLTMPVGATVGDLRRCLAERFPQLAELLIRSALAVGDEFADDNTVLATAANVALLPPVSGGVAP
jgi:molybdopterin converting factor subunit 1